MGFEYGTPLTDMQYRDLETRYITRFWADAAHLRTVDDENGKELFKGKSGDYSGIVIPYFIPGVAGPVTYRLRRRNPEIDGRNGKPKKKYITYPGERNRLYIPPHITQEQLRDSRIPLVLVEGEFKALAYRRLAGEADSVPRFIPLALSGIWNWMGTVGKQNNENGERVSVKGVIPDFDLINFVSREVTIAFDQDEESSK